MKNIKTFESFTINEKNTIMVKAVKLESGRIVNDLNKVLKKANKVKNDAKNADDPKNLIIFEDAIESINDAISKIQSMDFSDIK